MLLFFCFIVISCTPANTTVLLTTSTTTIPIKITSTPPPIITNQPTKTTTPIIELLSSSEQFATQQANFPSLCQDVETITGSISPSGNWIAFNCNVSLVETYEIENKDGKHWTLFLTDYLNTESAYESDDLDKYGFFATIWSKDDDYLLFNVYDMTDYGGTCYYGNGVVLYNLDLQSGAVTPFLLSSNGAAAYIYDISMDGRKFIYHDNGIVIFDLQTNEKTTIAFDFHGIGIGDFTWSPDGKSLAFATCQPDEDYFDVIKSTIEIYSLETHTLQTILTKTDWCNIERTNDDSKFFIYCGIQPNPYIYDWSSSAIDFDP